MRRNLFVSSAIAVLGSGLVSLPINAQAQSADAEDEEARFDPIIVTGEKRERTLQDTNSSVAVLNAEELDANNITNVSDVIELVAGVNTTQEGRGYSIRGANVTFSQTVDAGIVNNAPLSSIYVDGVALPAFQTIGGPTRAWDVSQIEVFRGPQSTVLGRNALTGAILVRTENPSFTPEARLRAEIAEFGREAYAGVISGGLTDTLAGRLSVEYLTEDGDISNPFLGIDDQDFVETTSIRGKLLYEAQNAPFSALVTINHIVSEEGFGGVYDADNRFGVPNPDPFLREGWNNTPVFDDRTTTQAIVELNYDFNERWSLTSVTGYTDAELFGQKDGDNGPILEELGIRDRQETSFSEELRFNYESEALSGVMGVFLFQSDFELTNFGEFGDIFAIRDGSPIGIPPVGAAVYANPAFGLPDPIITALNGVTPEFLEIQFGDTSEYENTNYAVFADFDWLVAPSWTVSFGARVDYQEYEFSRFEAFANLNQDEVDAYLGDVSSVLSGAPGFPAAAIPQVVGAIQTNYLDPIAAVIIAGGGSQADANASDDETVFLPKIGVTYSITDEASVAFTVQRGYRTGGVSFQASTGTLFPYDPEFTWNYEAALRTAWMDGRVLFNANAYYVDWTDQQIAFQEDLSDPFSTKTINAGESTVQGIEVELIAQPNSDFSFGASLAYNDSEFNDFQTGSLDFSGNPFALAPEWTGSLRAAYSHPSGFFVSGNAIYVDDRFQFERATNRLGSYTVANARAGYRHNQFEASLFVNNLFDEEYLTQNRSTVFSSVGNPQTIGGSLTVDF